MKKKSYMNHHLVLGVRVLRGQNQPCARHVWGGTDSTLVTGKNIT